MMLGNGQPQAKDVVDTRLKVQSIQQWVQRRLEPQLHILQDMMLGSRHDEELRGVVSDQRNIILEQQRLGSSVARLEAGQQRLEGQMSEVLALLRASSHAPSQHVGVPDLANKAHKRLE